jgi:hypothetical protein
MDLMPDGLRGPKMVPRPMAIKPIAVATMMNKAMAVYSRSILPPRRRYLCVPAAKYIIRRLKALIFTIDWGINLT